MKKAVGIALIVVIVGIIIVAINNNQDSADQPTALSSNYIEKTNESGSKKIVDELNALVKVDEEENRIVAKINNAENFNSAFPQLKKPYDGDVLVSTPSKTLIYDQSTKTIRDISNISIYEEVEQIL